MTNTPKNSGSAKPIILITGASGNIGTELCKQLKSSYTTIGLDRSESKITDESHRCDLTSADSIALAMSKIKADHGSNIAAVVHLAAYFDFTGKPNPMYQKVNVDGTRNLIEGLKEFEVERFIYSSTMLVHQAGVRVKK